MYFLDDRIVTSFRLPQQFFWRDDYGRQTSEPAIDRSQPPDCMSVGNVGTIPRYTVAIASIMCWTAGICKRPDGGRPC